MIRYHPTRAQQKPIEPPSNWPSSCMTYRKAYDVEARQVRAHGEREHAREPVS